MTARLCSTCICVSVLTLYVSSGSQMASRHNSALHTTYSGYTWQWEQQINTKCCLNFMTLFSCWLHFNLSVSLQRSKEMLIHYQWHCTCRKPCPLPTCFPLYPYLGPPPVALLLAVSPAGPSTNDCTLVGHSSLDCLSFSYFWQATTYCLLHKVSH